MSAIKDRFIKFEKKIHFNPAELTSDEEIVYLLRKHVDTFHLNNMFLKIYFGATDPSMDASTKIWINLIHPDFFPSYHCHDYYEFNVIFEGQCIEIVNNNVIHLKKGDILILPANSAFHTHFLKQSSLGCNILVKSSFLSALKDKISVIKNNFLDKLMKNNGFCIIHSENIPNLTEDVKELLDIYVKENKTQANSTPPSALSRMYSETTFQRMILKICEGIEDKRIVCEFSDSVQRAPSSDEIITYIKDNHTTVTTEGLAKKFGYSQRQLNRIIKKHTGNNFSTLITCERIIHAKNLLKNTSLSVSEISKAVGLDSVEYFCNMFKKQTGLTTTQYKNIARNSYENEI